MYLKSLELFGFKSFPNKTVLNFEPGATVIIGPNGSGKSNISDAMRWVLGEISSKSIRGNRMEDVIFGGADSRKPMSFAEVSVTFDNTYGEHKIDVPYDEITVTRRYYRSGDSEYFINRKGVRLKDIHELFMNTGIGRDGYSVIGQGKIGEILSRKSEDRRNIFEEAAGIAKFRYKRHEAELKLNQTEENMVRINDILSELSSRVGPLEKDSEKAKKYLELYENKKRADVALWIYDSQTLKDRTEEAEKNVKLSEHELELAEDTLNSLQTQSDRLYEESQSGKMNSEKLLTEITECTDAIHRIDSENKVADNEIAHKKELIAKTGEAIENSDGAIKAIELEKEQTQAQKLEIENDVNALEAEYAQLLERQLSCAASAENFEKEIDEKRETARTLQTDAVDIKVRISALESSKQSDFGKSEDVQSEIAKCEADAAKIKEETDNAQSSVDMYRSHIDEADELTKKCANDFETQSTLRDSLLAKIGDTRVRHDGLVGRAETLERMEELFEGYSAGVRFVMQKYDANEIDGAGKIYGPVSKLINVPKEYVTAIETAFGQNIQNIVVDNEATAKAAINALKFGRAGRATFYPLTSVTAQDETEEMKRAKNYEGYLGRADLLFEYDEKFSEVMRSVLGRTLVFDNLDNASKMAREQKYHVKVVTLDGQVINAGGSYTGGAVKHDSGILTRSSEIASLREQAKATAAELKKLESDFEQSEKSLKTAQIKQAEAYQQKEIISTMLSAETARLEAAQARLASNAGLLQKLYGDIEKLDLAKNGYEEEINALRAELSAKESEIEEIRNYRAIKEGERHDAEGEREELSVRANEVAIKATERKKDVEACDVKIALLCTRISEIISGVAQSRESIAEYEAELSAIIKKQSDSREIQAQHMARLDMLTHRRSEIESGTAEYDRKLNEARIKINEKTKQKETVFMSHTRNISKLEALHAEQDKLTEKMFEEYELTYAAALETGIGACAEADRAKTASMSADLRRQIKSLGPVNVNAIEEYAQVRVRYDELSKQVTDLDGAKRELDGVIGKLEDQMRESFVDAFNKINENFAHVFTELFGGGRAELVLTEPEDVLTSGIEIKAAPPGKIIKSLMLLSGGEQAFVAIALFFAILKVNPSPFCILDEIEAALDEVNVARFAEYVKHMSDNTQFVLITHRRGTMEAADRMYGVTMPERGVSKVLALSVSDMENKKKEDIENGIF